MAQASEQPTPTWISEHGREVLRQLLQLDSNKWLPVPQAIRALVQMLGFTLLQAAVELLKLMRDPGGAMPAVTRRYRLRDGLPTSHVITHDSQPADWDAVSPESLIGNFREIREGDGNVTHCWDFVDRQRFDKWLSARIEQARREREQTKREQTKREQTDLAPPLMEPKVWFAQAREQYPRRPKEGLMDYARRLHDLMQNAPVTKMWTLKTLRRRFDDRQGQQRRRRSRSS